MLICKDQKHFTYQCLENVKMYKYAKLDQLSIHFHNVYHSNEKKIVNNDTMFSLYISCESQFVLNNDCKTNF